MMPSSKTKTCRQASAALAPELIQARMLDCYLQHDPWLKRFVDQEAQRSAEILQRVQDIAEAELRGQRPHTASKTKNSSRY
jgi:hypothetical protein